MSSSMETAIPKAYPRKKGEPTWEVAYLFPSQGNWTEEEYLALDASRLVELCDGYLEFPAMPTPYHQLIVQFLSTLLSSHVRGQSAGIVLFAPLPVRLRPGTFREPDIVYLRHGRLVDRQRQPEGADLVMEVVSEGLENRKRDLETKPREYAEAGITEYWIVDPEEKRITVLTLEEKSYREHGVFLPGTHANSLLLPGFTVAVDAVFNAGQEA